MTDIKKTDQIEEKLKKILKETFQTKKITLKSKMEETFICKNEKGNYIGFINLSLKYDHILGTTSYPTAYVEGIFVKEQYRKNKVARKLMVAGEDWAKSKGCKEMGSDTELSNKSSQAFHKKLGFKEKNILVHFIKKI